MHTVKPPPDTEPTQWAVVELLGHQKIAGRVSTHVVGGASFLRVDVPATKEAAPFTKLFGAGALYGMTFVTETVATSVAERLGVTPVRVYDLAPEHLVAIRRLTSPEQRALGFQAPPSPADLALDDTEDADEDEHDSHIDF